MSEQPLWQRFSNEELIAIVRVNLNSTESPIALEALEEIEFRLAQYRVAIALGTPLFARKGNEEDE